MKVLISGISGFLGSHIAHLFSNENIEVFGLIRNNSNLFRLKNLPKIATNLKNLDKVPLETIFQENTIDAVIHLATDYGRTSSTEAVIHANLLFPIQLLELAVKHKVRTFINTDSYFNKNDNYLNSSLPNYSLTKKSFQMWLKQFSTKIQVINVCLEHMYGPFDSNTKFVESLIQNVAVLKKPTIDLTRADQKRDFIYVSDVADAYLRILNYSKTTELGYKDYELGTSISTPLRDFVELVLKLSVSQTKPNYGAIPQREHEIMESVADNKSLLELGWKPLVTPTIGIKKILEAYKL